MVHTHYFFWALFFQHSFKLLFIPVSLFDSFKGLHSFKCLYMTWLTTPKAITSIFIFNIKYLLRI